MKPKRIFLTVLIVSFLFAIISFVESNNSLPAGCSIKERKVCCSNQMPAEEIAGSSYIFFESVSKHLLISLLK